MQGIVQVLIIVTFTFGSSIFYFLASIERPIFKLITKEKNVKKEDINPVYQTIKRLISTLPLSFGFVILIGSILLVIQGFTRNWDLISIFTVFYFWIILLFLILVRNNPLTVKKIRNSPPDEDFEVKKENLKNLIIDHHLGLIANLGVLVMEMAVIILQ